MKIKLNNNANENCFDRDKLSKELEQLRGLRKEQGTTGFKDKSLMYCEGFDYLNATVNN